MEPRIETLKETRLTGMKLKMSFANNRTMELWRRFMSRKKEINNAVGAELFSVEVYSDPSFFTDFNPVNEFEKWAAVRVSDLEVPEGMDALIIPEGQYAVFLYKGKPSEAKATYEFIYGNWLPGSGYILDARPHFALMGEKYKGEHPDSEEELWIPVRRR